MRRRACALAALAFGLSALGGEPAVTLMGAAAFVAVAIGAGKGSRPRATAAALSALVLGAGLAAIQILPAALEMARSARGAGMRPEHGALFWSVRPARVLTLLEPRLTGDPAGDAASFWGSATFDAGSPYFEDLALGLVPLLLAAAAWRDRRGRAALLLALAGAVLSFGRFLPGYSFLAAALPVVRYPEKWWLLVTFALAAAAAVGVEAVFFGEAEARARARTILLRRRRSEWLSSAARFSRWRSALKIFLERVLWAVGLGAGDTSGAAVASALRPPLLLGDSLTSCSSCAVALTAARLPLHLRRKASLPVAPRWHSWRALLRRRRAARRRDVPRGTAGPLPPRDARGRARAAKKPGTGASTTTARTTPRPSREGRARRAASTCCAPPRAWPSASGTRGRTTWTA